MQLTRMGTISKYAPRLVDKIPAALGCRVFLIFYMIKLILDGEKGHIEKIYKPELRQIPGYGHLEKYSNQNPQNLHNEIFLLKPARSDFTF